MDTTRRLPNGKPAGLKIADVHPFDPEKCPACWEYVNDPLKQRARDMGLLPSIPDFIQHGDWEEMSL